MVCALTGGKSSKAEMLSLATSRHFIDWLHKQAVFTHSAPLSAGRVTQILLSGSGLQQLRQSVNIRLNRPGGDVAPCTWPADHQRVVAIPAAFDGKDVIAWQ